MKCTFTKCSYTATTTYTSTVIPTCYTTDLLVLGRGCTIKTVLGVVPVGGKKRRKREDDVVQTKPIVTIDGVEVDYDDLIRPQKVSAEKSKYFFKASGFLQTVTEEEIKSLESRREREVEIEGLPDDCLHNDPRARGFLDTFLTFLSRVTSTTISTSVAATTHSLTARITFKGCTPTDVSTIFPTSCS